MQEEFKFLTTEELNKLKNFKKNQNRSSRKLKILQKNSQEPSNMKPHNQFTVHLRLFDQETNKLLFAQSSEEKLKLLRDFRAQMGSFTFNTFLQSLHDVQIKDDMFQALFLMINDEPTLDHKKSLLLQACLFYDRSKVEIDHELIKAVFSEFKFLEQEHMQCLGFLYLLYENNSAAFSELSL